MKKLLAFGLLIGVCAILIGVMFVINNWLPLNFTMYFLLCAVSIIVCMILQSHKKFQRNTLIIPWLITTVTSFIITINYLSPKDARVYSNADANVLALKGLDVKDSIILIGKDKLSSFYDNSEYEGTLIVKPSQTADEQCEVTYNVLDLPIYINSIGLEDVKHIEKDSLLNACFLPSFDSTLSIISNDSLKCTIQLTEVNETNWFSNFHLREKVDSMVVTIFFESVSDTIKYNSGFTKRIKQSYNLYDVVHNGLSFNPQEEEIIERLKNVLLIRNTSTETQNQSYRKFFITYNSDFKGTSLLCDGVLFAPNYEGGKHILSSNENLYVGTYNSNTKPLCFSLNDERLLQVRYKFPYLNNFPRSSLDNDYHDDMRKILAISSSTDRLLQSDVKEAFFFNLFENENNDYNFSGTINYKVSKCNVPFTANIIDDTTTEAREGRTLLAYNKAIWHFAVFDLREQSPITGKNVPFANNSFILTLIAIICLFAFLVTQLFFKSSTKAAVVLGIWLFFIPLIVFRLYLLWRIAVFPPVTDITYAEFQRYRMENDWQNNAMYITFISITILIVFTILSILCENQIVLKSTWASKPLYKTFNWYKVLFYGCWIVSSLLALISTGVSGHIAAPVVFFIICEYISLKGLNYKWRITNVLFAFALLCIGDPGYAIMFFIFACVYFIIHLYAYLKSTPGILPSKAIAYVVWVSLFAVLGLIIIFSPQIVIFAYDDVTKVLFPFLTPSKIIFTCIAVLACAFLFLFFWIKGKKVFAFFSLGSIPIVAIFLIIVGTYVLEKKPHCKYRSLIHTETVSDIMAREDIDNKNSTRLLEASQNQWFIQYHNNHGDKRIFEDGLYSFSPHFKNGVSWNTQISDVIISRYVVGEISSVLPGVIVLFAMCFLILIFQCRNNSVASRSVCYLVALLIVIQMTFVWMAATNRMIFFGQDFPLLSQNARITMFMFIVLLGIAMILANPIKADMESAFHLSHGLSLFARKKKSAFIVVYLVVFAFVGLFGNKYASIYKEDGGDSGNASEYNLARMMNRCQADLSFINEKLSESSLETHKLENGTSVAALMDSLDADVKLSDFVNNKRQKNEISEFTLSMYNSFRKNLQRKNSISNIIHLKQNASQTHYEFALNNGFYSLKTPESENSAWHENIYSENVRHSSDKTFKSERNGLTIYGIPQSWLPNGNQIGIVDATDINRNTIQQIRILHSEQADYNANLPIYPIKSGDVLEVYSKDTKTTESFRYGISEKNLLVKNMVINGRHKFFYPLKEKCFWLKDFSEMASLCFDKDADSTIITLDKDLSLIVYDRLANTGKISSVIAMDGMGNVRLMADFRGKQFMLDPNNEEDINEKIIYHYLNPNPKEESNLFGNMNLCLLNPGPGSTLKPITYAAVTSQASYFPWEKLMLLNPQPSFYNYNDSIKRITIVNRKEERKDYAQLLKYGPSYKYSTSRPFQSIWGDEVGNGEWVDNLFYLSKSSNYYNALITYLGHYGSLCSEPSISTLFREANITDYPKITFFEGGIKYTFREAPEKTGNKESGIILLRGLYNNFSMPTHLSYADSLRYAFVGTLFNTRRKTDKMKLASLFPWVYPQTSSILEYKLNEHTAAERLRQYTIGSYPVVVTPLKMAEMYGKLYTLHPDYHASIIPNYQPFSEKWRNSDGEEEKGIYRFYQHNLFRGMKLCVEQGTAKDLRIRSLASETGYYYYAKTGTLLGTGAKLDDRMLAVIISNKDVEQIGNPNDARFFFIYFRYKEAGTMPQVYNIIKDIVESESFNYYMSK